MVTAASGCDFAPKCWSNSARLPSRVQDWGHISGRNEEASIVKTAHVKIGSNATIGLDNVIEIGVEIGSNCQIGALSFVPTHAYARERRRVRRSPCDPCVVNRNSNPICPSRSSPPGSVIPRVRLVSQCVPQYDETPPITIGIPVVDKPQ
jgi:hypothetical protein